MSEQQQPDVKATWTWGSSAKISLTSAAGVRGAQLSQVSLPEPAVCTIYFQAQCIRPLGFEGMRTFTVNFNIGLGRTVVQRTMTFLQQPSPPPAPGGQGVPLEVTIPFTPLQTLNVDFSADATIGEGDPPDSNQIDLEAWLFVAPITRIPLPEGNPIDLGMAEPGEADSLDDTVESGGDLYPDAPTWPEGPDEIDTEGEEVTPERLRIRAVIHRLARRFGRKPTRDEVRAALARIQSREGRRAR